MESMNKNNRKYPRVKIDVPVSCVSVDYESNPIDQNMGHIRNVSQGGVLVEANFENKSDLIVITFIDVDSEVIGIYGKVAHSKRNQMGTFDLGVELQGQKEENIIFVKKLIRLHHYTKKVIRVPPNAAVCPEHWPNRR
jgi:hypothetical protein